jgi:hypothetical protein
MTHFADLRSGRDLGEGGGGGSHAPHEYPLELLPAERKTDDKIGHEVGIVSELNRTRYELNRLTEDCLSSVCACACACVCVCVCL